MLCVFTPCLPFFFPKAGAPNSFCAALWMRILPVFISLKMWFPVTSFLLIMECLAELDLLFSFTRGSLSAGLL